MDVVGSVVGIVGAIDLSLRTLRSISTVATFSRRYNRFNETELRTIEAELRTQQAIITQTYEVLVHSLLPANVSERAFNNFGTPPIEELEVVLKDSLGDLYPVFLTLLRDVRTASVALEQALATISNKSKEISAQGQRLLSRSFHSRNKAREHVQQIRRGTEQLESLLAGIARPENGVALQAIENLSTALQIILEFGEGAKEVKDRTTAAESDPSRFQDDSRSIYSVESEVSRC